MNKSFTKKSTNIFAILGPTNTGKTYLAFDRLLSYNSGIFGFPLRLLARENYDKAIKRVGISKVALITGEEKILPSQAKYFFCTVESMPSNIEVECVAIDEVQFFDEKILFHQWFNTLYEYVDRIVILEDATRITEKQKSLFLTLINFSND